MVRSETGLQRGGDNKARFKQKGTSSFLGGHALQSGWTFCANPQGGRHMADRAIYLHLNVPGVDHFHNAHHIVKDKAKLLTVV